MNTRVTLNDEVYHSLQAIQVVLNSYMQHLYANCDAELLDDDVARVINKLSAEELKEMRHSARKEITKLNTTPYLIGINQKAEIADYVMSKKDMKSLPLVKPDSVVLFSDLIKVVDSSLFKKLAKLAEFHNALQYCIYASDEVLRLEAFKVLQDIVFNETNRAVLKAPRAQDVNPDKTFAAIHFFPRLDAALNAAGYKFACDARDVCRTFLYNVRMMAMNFELHLNAKHTLLSSLDDADVPPNLKYLANKLTRIDQLIRATDDVDLLPLKDLTDLCDIVLNHAASPAWRNDIHQHKWSILFFLNTQTASSDFLSELDKEIANYKQYLQHAPRIEQRV